VPRTHLRTSEASLGGRASDVPLLDADGNIKTGPVQGLSTRTDGRYLEHQLRDPEWSLDTSKLPDNLQVRVDPGDPGHPMIGPADGITMTPEQYDTAIKGTAGLWEEVINTVADSTLD
jgi:hypothetical protein